MKVKCIGIFFAVVSVFVIHGSLIGAAEHVRQEQSQSKSVCEEILVAKCSDCHHLTRVCQKLGKKSKGDWRRSIKRMIRKGAVLSKDEQKILVQCMYKQQEGAQKACQK
jgi:hypothetical protein